jgi:hypothetical protein
MFIINQLLSLLWDSALVTLRYYETIHKVLFKSQVFNFNALYAWTIIFFVMFSFYLVYSLQDFNRSIPKGEP